MRTSSLAYKMGGEAGIVVTTVFAERYQDRGVCQGLFVLRTIPITILLDGMIMIIAWATRVVRTLPRRGKPSLREKTVTETSSL